MIMRQIAVRMNLFLILLLNGSCSPAVDLVPRPGRLEILERINQASASTSYALPGVITPQGNASLATSVTYAASFAVTSVTGPNGAQGTTTYDTYGRPANTKIPDGASTDYTYTYYDPNVSGSQNTQKATLGTRWKKTTLDGFGRVT